MICSKKGFEVFGIDREVIPAQTIFNESWLEFDYGVSSWGTIISHLGFTNHFRHHHVKISGGHLQYANTFLRILHALKIGGSFYYAPDLPFIEAFLNPLQFSVTKNLITGTPFYSSCIKRLS